MANTGEDVKLSPEDRPTMASIGDVLRVSLLPPGLAIFSSFRTPSGASINFARTSSSTEVPRFRSIGSLGFQAFLKKQ
jgi:hypothetical protein